MSARWAPKLWDRVIGPWTLWVDAEYRVQPKWTWHVMGPATYLYGRARTRATAMRAAEKALAERRRRA